MGMVFLGAGPGMEHGHHPQLAAQVVAVHAELDQCGDCRLEEDRVEHFLIAAHHVPECRRQGKDQMEVGYGHEFRLPLFQPSFRIGAMTFGATGVLTGVIVIVGVTALVIAFYQMPPHFVEVDLYPASCKSSFILLCNSVMIRAPFPGGFRQTGR